MSTITQRIPNFLLGISQQPDNRKFPGQLKDCVNAVPDYALGLLKRPGGEFLSELYGASTYTGALNEQIPKWFPILKDQSEKYIAQYHNNTFKVWTLDGDPRAVDMGTNTGVPGSCNIANVKTTLNNYNNAVSDVQNKQRILSYAQAEYSRVLAGQSATTTSLFEVNYNYPVGSIDQYLVSGILLNSSGIYTTKNNNTVISSSTTLPAGYALGTEVTDEHPLLASEGYRVYKAILTVAAVNTAGELAAALAAMNTAQSNYNAAVATKATTKALYDTQVNNCNITTVPNNAYLKNATVEDIEVLTLNDYTIVLNKAKTVALKAATTPAKPFEAFILIKEVTNNIHYQVVLDGVAQGFYTSNNPPSAYAIASDLATDINGAVIGGKTFSATAVGAGLYISCTQAFSIEVRGGTQEDAMFIFQDSVSAVGLLPIQCKDGYIVRVSNTAEIDIDDMYVKFVTDGTATYGPGVWEETTAPGITYQFDELTMPHKLVRQADGSFAFSPISWEDRLVGDLNTNPNPSFVGSKINNIFFYRNRLGFLSNEAVILSRAGDYFNFWVTTAMTVTDDDPIDITASSVRSVNFRYVRPVSVGLVLFSDTEQFILSTDADILSPKTAKINELSTYECDSFIKAVNLGTSIAYVSKTRGNTRLFELSDISTDRPPTMSEQTKIVPELMNDFISSMVSSPSLGIVSLADILFGESISTVYQYRFLETSAGQRASSWYKWKIDGTLLEQFFDNNIYYAVIQNGTNVLVQSFDVGQTNEYGYLTLPTGERTDICLDCWAALPYVVYNSNTDSTRVYLPYNHFTDSTFCIVVLGGYVDDTSTEVNVESTGLVLYPTVQGSTGAYYVDIDGDYRGRRLLLGYNYTMEVSMPKFYVTSAQQQSAVSDFTSDLILHRIKVSTGLSGPVKYQVSISGNPVWNNTIESISPYIYDLNSVNMSTDAVHTIPVYQRNENLSFKIIGDTPFPVTLLSLNWEGKYNTGFYSRS